MAANNISQLTTANTFQHWLTASQLLIATANLLTNGNGETFYANTRLEVGGTNATLNVTTGASINVMTGNTTNTINLEARTVNITGNITSDVRATQDVYVGDDLIVYGDATVSGNTTITGDLTVTGNITLDSIGYDDLTVSGNSVVDGFQTVGGNLSVTGTTSLTNVSISGNVATLNVTNSATIGSNLRVDSTATINTLNVTATSNHSGNATFVNAEVTDTLTANLILGAANTKVYNAISQVDNSALAYAIALG